MVSEHHSLSKIEIYFCRYKNPNIPVKFFVRTIVPVSFGILRRINLPLFIHCQKAVNRLHFR